jgi:hypothetical protein
LDKRIGLKELDKKVLDKRIGLKELDKKVLDKMNYNMI